MYIFVKKKIVIKILNRNLFFIIPYFIFVIFISIMLLLYEKQEIHIYINSFHNPFFDFFFKYWTNFGHGLFAVLITLFLLFVKYKWAIISAVSNILTALIVQLLKRLIFTESFRPVFHFENYYSGNYDIYLVSGVDPGGFNSFPSGHSATAFAVFFLLSIIVKKKYLKLTFYIFALLIACSRVYLSWHFLGDVLAGSILGMIITIIVYLFINKSNSPRLEKSLLNKKN